MLNERRRRVLRALVDEYVASAQPVGSRTLVERYELGCSPATVRNELSILEETGYVAQPHVSAGRIPTDTGYRDFVDRLLERVEDVDFSPVKLPDAGELDELMRRTSALLAHLTDSLAVVIAPSISATRVKRIDLLLMGPRRALLVLIAESGRVLNRHIELDEETSPETIADVERSLNAALVGKRAAEIRPLRDALDEACVAADGVGAPEVADHGMLFSRIIDEILDTLEEQDRDRVHHVGVSSLLGQPEFHDAEVAKPLIESLEDGIVVLEALSDTLSRPGLTVRIGRENRRAELGGVSLVATSYVSGSADGVIGIIGPTRMDYRRAISAVKTVAAGLEGVLDPDRVSKRPV